MPRWRKNCAHMEVLMIIFKIHHHKNYTEEANLTLLHYHFLLQKVCSVGTWKGKIGHNLPCDLLMEHLKTVLKHVGLPVTIVKAAKSIGVVHRICEKLQHDINGRKSSSRHSKPSMKKDLELISYICVRRNRGSCK